MDRVWIRAIFTGLFCLFVGLVAFSCQWFASEKKRPRAVETGTSSAAHTVSTRAAFGGVIQAIKSRGELRVGMQVGFVPFQMPGPEGSLVGFDVDAAHLVARAMGVGLRIVRQNWGELIPSIVAGKTDLVMSGMTITPERNLEAVFTIPVFETGRMFLVNKRNTERFKRFRHLNQPGVFVVSGPGALGRLPIGDLLPGAGYREFPTSGDALNEVIQGRAHAYVDDEFAVRLAAARRPDLLVGRFTPLTYEPVAWAMDPRDSHWLNWLNNFIRLIQRDGRLDDLKKKWFQDYYLDMGAPPG